MKDNQQRIDLRSLIAQGWTTMFLLFAANLVMDLARCQVMDTCRPWAEHLGQGGLVVVTIVMMIYGVVPMLVRCVNLRFFRYVVVFQSIAVTLFYFVHEMTHLMAGDKPFGISHGLDILHHVIGVSVIVASILWAREAGGSEPASEAAYGLSPSLKS
ncbi:MAG: hypothetical protein V3T17_00955 [Pseudomonadales bacterium]